MINQIIDYVSSLYNQEIIDYDPVQRNLRELEEYRPSLRSFKPSKLEKWTFFFRGQAEKYNGPTEPHSSIPGNSRKYN